MKLKRIALAVIAVATIAMGSCQKEQEVKPSTVKAEKFMPRRNLGTYD